MKLRYTRQALADLDEARTYIVEHSPNAVAATAIRIREAVGGLRLYPEKGRPGRIEGTRELVVPNVPFIATYRCDGRTVDILAILHGARRWPSAFHT